jgi:hypothetical protein
MSNTIYSPLIPTNIHPILCLRHFPSLALPKGERPPPIHPHDLPNLGFSSVSALKGMARTGCARSCHPSAVAAAVWVAIDALLEDFDCRAMNTREEVQQQPQPILGHNDQEAMRIGRNGFSEVGLNLWMRGEDIICNWGIPYGIGAVVLLDELPDMPSNNSNNTQLQL